jgi:hypothetical protein
LLRPEPEKKISISITDEERMGQTFSYHSGIDHLVADIDIGQKSVIRIHPLLIELQSDFLPQDERFIQTFRFQEEGLQEFRRVDSQITDLSAIFQEKGVPIVDLLDPEELTGVCQLKKNGKD